MTKSKIAAIALTSLTIAASVAATAGQAQAKPKFGPHHLGFGIAAGIIGAAIASSAYAEPAYVVDPGYTCRYVKEYDAFGYPRVVRVCGAF